VLAGFLAGGWKILVAGGVAVAAGLRKFLGKKGRDDAN
jgi:hypothetical protein